VSALERVLYITLRPEARERYDEEAAFAKANQFKWVKATYKNLVGSKPIEEEGEIILDHNYDGIKELDNKLPPWWVYGFYVTILFAAIYLIRFEVFNDYTQEEEYEAAVAIAKAEIEEYKRTAKDLVDVNTVTLLTEVSDLKAGQSIFEGNCAACHKVSGGGGIGPNLTDDHWILGGGIKNVFNTISEGGRDGMGMVAWKSELKPSEMAQVASYVMSLHGSNPEDAKEAEGEVWLDPDAPVEEMEVQVIDSTNVQVIIEDESVTGDIIDNE
jgi:cytochrome c oxidase cbb3-type subunit 3